jgi:5-dehydro-2-deoxygluconokinase
MSNGLNPPVLMFAADHRWQWEEWFDHNGVDRRRIAEVKSLAADGFLHARAQSEDVRRSGALLIDPTYGLPEIARVAAAGAAVGTPAERAGAFPLEWASEPFDKDLLGSFVKVLVRHRPDHTVAVRDGQLTKLLTLQAWCRDHRKPFVLEVLVPREHEPEAEFESRGRPEALAHYITTAYDHGVVPDYWKIEGVPDGEAIEPIDNAIAQRPGVRQLVLGKNADIGTVSLWFTAAAEARTAGGFAIGRTMYWKPAISYLQRQLSRDEAVSDIASNYLRVVDLWMHPHRRTSLVR